MVRARQPRRTALARGALALLLALGWLVALPPAPARAATCVVTSPADSGPGSLRAALANSDGFANCTAITFQPGLGTVTLTGGALAIARDVTITGPGAAALTVRRSDAAGTPDFSVLAVGGGQVAISGLTITGGRATNGGGLFVSGKKTALTLTDATVSGNTAFGVGLDARMGNSGGGGGLAVYSDATLILTAATLSGNSATWGGGLDATFGGRATLTDVTVSGNTAIYGGGLFAIGPASVALANVTVSGNTATDSQFVNGGASRSSARR